MLWFLRVKPLTRWVLIRRQCLPMS